MIVVVSRAASRERIFQWTIIKLYISPQVLRAFIAQQLAEESILHPPLKVAYRPKTIHAVEPHIPR